ncbi:MAG: hypothetical protein H8Z69_04635 [Nanohaloarchaea archaeon]|nr:hypothetical protein [Candidatus Nanohaloarchaea archaeon]
MSLERRYESILQKGTQYVEPRFPEGIDSLNHTYDFFPTNGARLDEVGEETFGYEGMRRSLETEGDWFWTLEYNLGGDAVDIAFPTAQDWEQEDDVQLNHSIAVYAPERVGGETLENLVRTFENRFLENAYERGGYIKRSKR